MGWVSIHGWKNHCMVSGSTGGFAEWCLQVSSINPSMKRCPAKDKFQFILHYSINWSEVSLATLNSLHLSHDGWSRSVHSPHQLTVFNSWPTPKTFAAPLGGCWLVWPSCGWHPEWIIRGECKVMDRAEDAGKINTMSLHIFHLKGPYI